MAVNKDKHDFKTDTTCEARDLSFRNAVSMQNVHYTAGWRFFLARRTTRAFVAYVTFQLFLLAATAERRSTGVRAHRSFLLFPFS